MHGLIPMNRMTNLKYVLPDDRRVGKEKEALVTGGNKRISGAD
jgi:hypothetical protein